MSLLLPSFPRGRAYKPPAFSSALSSNLIVVSEPNSCLVALGPIRSVCAHLPVEMMSKTVVPPHDAGSPIRRTLAEYQRTHYLIICGQKVGLFWLFLVLLCPLDDFPSSKNTWLSIFSHEHGHIFSIYPSFLLNPALISFLLCLNYVIMIRVHVPKFE